MNPDNTQHDKMNEDNESRNPFADMPVVFSYTRQQALDDGMLVDLTEWAKETGFRIPVACTRALWDGHLEPPKGTEELGQSLRGRTHDLLWMLYVAIRKASASNDLLHFEVIFLSRHKRHETVQLKAVCGPGDQGEPVLTVMLPNED